MKHADFTTLVHDTHSRTIELLIVKGGEYAGDDDRLSNFKRGAATVAELDLYAFIARGDKCVFCKYRRCRHRTMLWPRGDTACGKMLYFLYAHAMFAAKIFFGD